MVLLLCWEQHKFAHCIRAGLEMRRGDRIEARVDLTSLNGACIVYNGFPLH